MKIKSKFISLVSSLFLISISTIGLYYWFQYRNLNIRLVDYFILFLSFLSILWIMIWIRYFGNKEHSLIIPWGPILLVPTFGILGKYFKLISSFEVFNLFILFYCSYLISTLLIQIISLAIGKSLFYLPGTKINNRL